ncbi:flagellar biosynthesis protein [Celeribacter arenosi]|uniref:Flagellar biosynthesis protein n=1 Tax=Celeribacter arenosi TaxID=792649 RepID=A0ABP7JY61_9RHOB
MKHTCISLEDFGVTKSLQKKAEAAPPPVNVSSEELEEVRLAAYERGYKAGWDDAVRAEGADQSRIGADFAHNLQELGFTFHEARAHVMRALEPLLEEMVSKVLPHLVTQTLGQTIVSEIMSLGSQASDAPVQLVISPNSLPAVKTYLDSSLSLPVDIIEEPSLAEGQVFLRLGDREQKIDLDGAIAKISEAINSVYTLNEEVFKNG